MGVKTRKLGNINDSLIQWQAVTVADGSTTLNAEAGKGYFLDTNAGVIEVFLPASPSIGDTFVFADYSGTFATNRVLINTRGTNIDSTVPVGEFRLDTNNLVVELIYVDNEKGYLVKENETKTALSLIQGGDYEPAEYVAATGGTTTTVGDFKYHKFTGDGCFVVSAAGNPKGSSTVQALVVAGGGGGEYNGGGGGGAGGLRNLACQSVSVQTYPITVGGGGNNAHPGQTTNTNGSNSVFSTITSAGGGKGGAPSGGSGGDGGSGGGAGGNGGNAGAAGSGNVPPVSPSQGNPGGSHGPVPNYNAGAGGGGHSTAGSTAPNPGTSGTPGGHGGNGTDVTPDFPGPTGGSTFAGGGGGGANDDGPGTASDTPNAPGGGGEGAGSPGQTAGSGTANTGGGGGGAPTAGTTSGSGGKGIVIIKYRFQTS
jgi:hypothetical protein